MKQLLALLKKDFKNAKHSLGPALLLGIPLLLILGFGDEIEDKFHISWRSAFWLSYFISSTSVFFRSFGFENRYQNFHIYTALRVSRLKIFWSQCFVQWLMCCLLGAGYLVLVCLFWSPNDISWGRMIGLSVLTSACLAPSGTLLGLMLQWEREFLFSLFFLPLATPVILGAQLLSLQYSVSWFYVGAIFLLISSFFSSLIFEFFFDELTQSQ